MKIHLIFFALLICFNIKAQETYMSIKGGFEYLTNSSTLNRVPTFNKKDDTKGSQYLFPDFVPGIAVNGRGQLVEKQGLLFNYDKLKHDLYMMDNKKAFYLLNISDVKSLTLMDSLKQLQFENIPIDKAGLAMVLVKDPNKFSLYKTLNTKFVPSNFVNSGLFQSGHNYDEFVDEPVYFILSPTGTYDQVQLKRNAINKFFSQNKKAQAFIKQHASETINEDFLKNIIISLNN